MKKLIVLLISSFVFVACTGSSDSNSPAVPPTNGQGQSPSKPANAAEAKLSKTLSLSFTLWKNSAEPWQANKATPEELKITNEYLLGQALRYIDELQAPEKLLMVRADFKNRQGPQSEADFLPLAKKILEKN